MTATAEPQSPRRAGRITGPECLDVLLKRWGEIRRQLLTGEIDSYGHETSGVIHRNYGAYLPRLPKDHDRTYQTINPYVDYLLHSPENLSAQAAHVVHYHHTEGESKEIRKAYRATNRRPIADREYTRRLALGKLLLFELIRHARPDLL